MKYKHLFWGIILISIGLLFLLSNLGVLHFSWFTFWRLWPVILILWGISILPIKDLFRFILLVAVVITTFTVINRLPEKSPWFWRWHNEGNAFHFDIDDDNDTTAGNYEDQKLMVPFDSLTKKGILDLDAKAGNFQIDSTSTDLLSFSKTGDIGNYELTTDNRGGRRKISLNLQESKIRHTDHKNNVIIRLNKQIPWNFSLNIGAASMNMDLSGYKIDTAEIDAGAASVDLKLGNLSPVTYVNIDGGASSFNVKIPKDAGCQVKSESFLVSKNLEGFVKKGDNMHQTMNWNTSKNKIYIELQTAVSSINIQKY
ncbi:MAG: LiaI-LiaF-like domain-containing protein [Syntrophothermus sp.]